MFSRIASRFRGETNPLYRVRGELEAQGESIVDLVSGNVTEHGILFPEDVLRRGLVHAAQTARVYRPDPLGQKSAREAISSYYREQGIFISPENVLLTPGTSISYWYCFRLLANEGEEILCPRPSYPLFDYIAQLSGVRLVPYRMDEARQWSIDLDHLEASISTSTRSLILISPHNPTGHVAALEEIHAIAELAQRHDLAIISDEVFSEFLFRSAILPRPASSTAPLVFSLNGFSKMLALPGIKLGWMAVSGDAGRVQEAMRALELISDTFLPVNEIVQAATPVLFEEAQRFRRSYSEEIRQRWRTAEQILATSRRLSFVEPDGGFYVTVKLDGLDEGCAAEALLRKARVLVHPGHFYDIDSDHLVLSFVQEQQVIEESFRRVVATLDQL